MTSYGQQLLGEYLKCFFSDTPLVNHRPLWLSGLELDFYYPDRHLGFEFQGDQHYIDTPRFGTCFSQQRRDRAKVQVCREHNVQLVRVTAADLEYTRLKGMVRLALKRQRQRFGVKTRLPHASYRQWGPINKRAIEYRATLKGSFDSPTAFRKGRTRKAAVARAVERFSPALNAFLADDPEL